MQRQIGERCHRAALMKHFFSIRDSSVLKLLAEGVENLTGYHIIISFHSFLLRWCLCVCTHAHRFAHKLYLPACLSGFIFHVCFTGPGGEIYSHICSQVWCSSYRPLSIFC